MQASIEGARVRTRRFGWVVSVAFIAVFGAVAAFMFPIYVNTMQPPPDAKHLASFQASIDRDGLPVEADALIACEMDRGSYLGEGTLKGSWAEMVDGSLAQAKESDSVLVKTKEGDVAHVRRLRADRVRVYSGVGIDEDEAKRVFAAEMKSGQGRHPVYRQR